MRDKLRTQFLISKGIIANYEREVIPNEPDTERRFKIMDTIEAFKKDLAAAEFFLANSYDEVYLKKHLEDLKCYLTILKEI